MFKNCCGCSSKKYNRNESKEDEDDDEKKEKEVEVIEDTAKIIAQQVEPVKQVETPKEIEKPEIVQRKPSSMKKAKPRLSISTDVKIIPSNFPEEMEDYRYDEGSEVQKKEQEKNVEEEDEDEEEDEEEEEEDEPKSTKIMVKNIDGKIIRKSQSGEGSRKPSLEGELRTASPLSDEVFAPNEKSHLELPLHNLGVKIDKVVPLGLESTGSPKKYSGYPHKRVSMPAVLPKWLSEEDETGGSHEPPATPVARDELALRRHRFFSELLSVAQAATEHRVRFDPFGPTIEILSEVDQGSAQAHTKEFDKLLNRLEHVTLRLEKTVPLLEKGAKICVKNLVVTKNLEDYLNEQLTLRGGKEPSFFIVTNPDFQKKVAEEEEEEKEGEEEEEGEEEKEEEAEEEEEEEAEEEEGEEEEEEDRKKKENKEPEEKDGFIIISPDSSADFDELSDKDLVLLEEERFPPCESDKVQNSTSDKSENSSFSQDTVVIIWSVNEDELKASNEVKKDSEKLNEEEKADMTNNQSTLSMSVQGFQQVLQGPFASYLQISAKIGGDVAEHAKQVQEAFQAQLQYLTLASQSSKPSTTDMMKLLQPTSERIEAIQTFREKNRTSQYFNHLSAISESIPALGWVTVSPAPAPYVKEMNDAGQFYTNRVLKDWKEKDKIHVEWTKAWVQTLSELQAYVKQYHTTGLVWGGTSAPRVSAAPPPPPGGMPPPPPMLDLGDVAPAGPGQDRSALFAEINQGENITRNLKKVTADMQTHKNPAIRTGPAPFKTPPASITNQVPRPFKAASPPEKPPKFAREGKKWFIEHQKGNHQLVVENAEMNNVVYVFKCTDSTLVVKGKVNSIFLDSCKKTAVVFDSVVSSIEFVNCQSVQMQVLGTVPTISIDKSDGCQMYLSQDSLNVEIVSSKSSEMNVLVPTGTGDFKEHPIPEQFKTTVSKQGLKTTAVENKG